MKVRYMSNGGFIMDDYINTSETQQLKSAIQYIITGFLFASLTIDIGWIPEIEGLISVLWFFIGLRMTKGLNRKLKYAYYFSLYFLFAYLFTTIVNVQTPFTIPSYYYTIHAILKVIQMTLIFLGLKENSSSMRLDITLFSYYMICLIGTFFGGDDISFLIWGSVLFFIYIVYHQLKKCKQDAIDCHLVMESNDRVSTGIIMIGYCISLFVAGYIIIWIWPLTSYHYHDLYQLTYHNLEVLDVTDQIEGWDSATIYSMNDYQNLYVFHKQEKLDKRYAMIDSEIYCNYGLDNYDVEIGLIDFANGEQSYEVNERTPDYFPEIDSFFNSSSSSRRYYRVFVNPFDETIHITLEIQAPISTIDNEDDEEQSIVVSGEFKYYEYGDTYFGDMHNYKSQSFYAFVYKSKWVFND